MATRNNSDPNENKRSFYKSKTQSLYYGWVIVGVVFFTEFVAGGVGGMILPLFFKPMSESLGWSLTQLTGAITTQTLAYIAIAPLLGTLLDRLGARVIMVFGAITAGIGLILLTQVEEVWQFWLIYGLVGALGLHEMGGFTGTVVITKWFVRMRGRAIAIATLGTTIGGAIMAPVIGIFIATIGWRHTWGLMGIILLALVVPIIVAFMRREPEDLGLNPDGDPNPETLDNQSSENGGLKSTPSQPIGEIMWTRSEAFRTRTLWVLVLALNLINLATSVIVVHLVPFLTLQEGISAEEAGFILSLRLASASFARILWGYLTERVPLKLCLASSFLFRTLSIVALISFPYPWNAGLMLLANIPGGAFAVLQPMVFSNYFGRRFAGSIQGAVRPFVTISQLISPLFIALLFDITGTFQVAFLIASAFGLLGTIVVLFAAPPKITSNP